MTIAVIDGQGGGIGAHIIEKLQKTLPESSLEKIEIIALGTNAIATSLMMKAGANKAATGENSIVHISRSADIIIGSWAITVPNSMLGELTPVMAAAISSSGAKKLLLPLPQQGIELIGVIPEPFPHMIDKLIDRIKRIL
ncbi:MAG: DUF3842 family protein [Nitrospirae bacterium]|nr:DUF3842 family protein [Nitrospirota bacterium]